MSNQPFDETSSDAAFSAESAPLDAPVLWDSGEPPVFAESMPDAALRARLRFYAESLIATSERHTDEAELGRLHYQLARTHAAAQNYSAAESHCMAATLFFGGTEQVSQQAHTFLLLGGLRDYLEDYFGALDALARAAELGEQLNDNIFQARVLDSTAQLFERNEEFEKALKRYRRAEQLLGLGDEFSHSEAVQDLRLDVVASISFVQAELIIRQALELAERLNRPETSPIELPTPGGTPPPRLPGVQARFGSPSKPRPPRRRRRRW